MKVKFLQESHIFVNTEANIQKLPKTFQKCFLDSDINNEFSDGKRHSIIAFFGEKKPRLLVVLSGYDSFLGEGCSLQVFSELKKSRKPVHIFCRYYQSREVNLVKNYLLKIAKAPDPIKMCQDLYLDKGDDYRTWTLDWHGNPYAMK